MTNLFAELTSEELATLDSLITEKVNKAVHEILDAYIDDGLSDEGLTLRPEVEARLLAFLRDRPAGQDASEVFRELGLDV